MVVTYILYGFFLVPYSLEQYVYIYIAVVLGMLYILPSYIIYTSCHHIRVHQHQ